MLSYYFGGLLMAVSFALKRFPGTHVQLTLFNLKDYNMVYQSTVDVADMAVCLYKGVFLLYTLI